MKKATLLVTGALAALTLAPGVSFAQWADPSCVRSNHDSRVEGTVLGALGGALAGGLLGHGLGAGLGAVGGAAIGNSWAGARNDPCPSYYAPPPPPPPAYGYRVYEPSPPPPPPPPPPVVVDDGLMHWAGSLESRVVRDRDMGLLTNREMRGLDDQLAGVRQRYRDLRWSNGGYLYPGQADSIRYQLRVIDDRLHGLEYQGS